MAFHHADTDTYTDSPDTSIYTSLRPIRTISSRGSQCRCRGMRHGHPRKEIACVGRKTVAVFGESVSVSAPWNASFTA